MGYSLPAPSAGTGSLTVAASQQLTLLGNFALQGIANAVLSSRGDVQLQGSSTATPGPVTGSVLTDGNLEIDGARVYPDTFTDYTIQTVGSGANGSGNTVTIGQTRASPGTPLSAGGAVTVESDNIVVGGTLIAPFGQIALDATQSLTLANGSLVSVSGAGLDIPYGQTIENGGQWLIQNALGAQTTITAVPAKQVTLTAPNISVQKSAVVDLQGGGDLYAYEWVPGSGGKSDALAGSGSSQISGLYAIVPSMAGQAAPYDPQESANFGPTQTVYLSGGAGIAAGAYALLPPRYALLPGAVLIQVEPSYTSPIGGQIGSLGNGAPVIAGYLSSTGTDLHTGSSLYQGFAVYPGSYGQQLATYTINQASGYFGAAAKLAGAGPVAEPVDAGTLTFNILQSMNALLGSSFDLEGNVLSAAASGGRGALINISAPDLEITSGAGAATAGSIAVSASLLQGWKASDYTLGGSSTANSGNVAVTASSVTVESGVQLVADQILLVAQQSIDIKSGASLSTTSAGSGVAPAANPAATAINLTDASGNALPGAGLVAISDLALPVVARSGTAAAGATIELASGSTLSSRGAIALDAPGSVVIDGAINGKGAAWSLGSSSIAFTGSGSSTDTLSLNTATVALLQQAGSVRLASQGSIDIVAPVTLGAASAGAAPTLQSLTLLGTDINNQSGKDSVFGAASVTLEGVSPPASGNAAPVTPLAGNGTLNLVAGTLNIGPNTLAVSGFNATVANVSGAIQSTGTGGLNVAGDLALNAGGLTPGAGSQTAIAASGNLSIGAPSAVSPGTALPVSVGGSLSLVASTITDAGVIAAPSGIVALNATGGDLVLAPTASINVGGTLLYAADRVAASPGGSLSLSASGNLSVASGATLDVAGQRAAPAGTLSIIGGKTVTLSGTIDGAAGNGGVGGSFLLDAGYLAGGLAPLAASLASGGFTDSVNVRVRTDNLVLPGGSAIDANSITLTADTGTVDIYGVLNAPSAAQRGLIDLSAGTSVTLESTAQLHADGLGGYGLGGEIDLTATCATCSLTLDPGSVITTAGSTQSGELVLRAPALVAQNDVAINYNNGVQGIGATVDQAGTVIVDAVLPVLQTSGGTVNGDLASELNSASNFLTGAASGIATRLSSMKPGATPVSVQAGVELQDLNAADTLTFTGLVDLSSYSNPNYYGTGLAPQVINVTVRAAGSISINGTISDGFIADLNTGATALSTTPSASLTFVAGADVSSANPLSVMSGSGASLTLVTARKAPDGTPDGVGPAVVRTGTGDINLVASGDVVFQAGTSAYTGGEQPANVIGPVGFYDLHNNAYLQNFGTGGGTVLVSAGGDIVSAPIGSGFTNFDNGNSGVTAWQLRQGNAQNPAQYGVDFGAFDWSVGALGGGDVKVTAGGNISDISAAVSDNLVSGANLANGAATNQPVLLGAGGGLSIVAGGDIGSLSMFVADGVGTVKAGGGLTAIQNIPKNISTSGLPVGAAIALDNAEVAVWARNGIQINALYNPTIVGQTEQSLSPDDSGAFFTYGPASSVSLSSTAGDVVFQPSSFDGTTATLVGAREVAASAQSSFQVAPPNLTLQALQNDIVLNSSVYLFPSATGQLSLFAGRDIVGSGGGFTLSDSPPATLPSVANPQLVGSQSLNAVVGLLPFLGVIHSGDPNPVSVAAGRDIDNLDLSIPKATTLVAGRDIVNLKFAGQDVSPDDVTLIAAGRDLVDQPSAQNQPGIQLGGPGRLDVLTGRNLNLGFSDGITTTGNLVNANLPIPVGADITLAVGYGTQGADLAGFFKSVIEPSATYQAQLTAYVESLTGASGLTFAQAVAQFTGFTNAQQGALIDNVFFNELLASGRAANAGSGTGFAQGYAAIDALYPGSRAASAAAPSPYAGDLTLTSSEIYSAERWWNLDPGAGRADRRRPRQSTAHAQASPRTSSASSPKAPATSASIRWATSTSTSRAFYAGRRQYPDLVHAGQHRRRQRLQVVAVGASADPAGQQQRRRCRAGLRRYAGFRLRYPDHPTRPVRSCRQRRP